MSIKSSVAAKMQHKKEKNNTEEKKSVLVTLYSDSFSGLGPVQNSMKFSSATFHYILVSLNPSETSVIPAWS